MMHVQYVMMLFAVHMFTLNSIFNHQIIPILISNSSAWCIATKNHVYSTLFHASHATVYSSWEFWNDLKNFLM